MRQALLVAAALVAALAPIARADDSPGLALAKQVVDEVRGDEHKAKMRIVWPEKVEATPPEGAEVTLITGYIDYTLTRLVWHDGKVEARAVTAKRSWFYNPDGESFTATEFDVEPAEFAASWAAARYVAGARDERIEPEPAEHPFGGGGMGAGSHSPVEWIRLRLADESTPVVVCAPLGTEFNWEDVQVWSSVRDRSGFKCFGHFVDRARAGRFVAPASFASMAIDDIRRATTRVDLAYMGEHRLLLETCLRVAGEFGDANADSALDALDIALTKEDPADYVVQMLRGEVQTARTKLRLTHHWDATEAERVIRAGPKFDLAKWARRRFRAEDPVAYLALVTGASNGGGIGPDDDLVATIDALRAHPNLRTNNALHRLLADPSPDVRVAAARAVLALEPADAGAIAVLLAVADDAGVSLNKSDTSPGSSRVDALGELVARKVLGSDELRVRLADPHPAHARLVRALLDGLKRTSAPPTVDEELTAWRRVVSGPDSNGLADAVAALLDLHDVASRHSIDEALDRMQEALPLFVKRPDLQERVDALRKRFAAEMPAPPAPK